MGLFEKLFGKKQPQEQSDKNLLSSRPIIIQKTDDPSIKINPHKITHAYIALTHADLSHFDDAKNDVASFNRACHSSIWSIPFVCKMGVFATNVSDLEAFAGYPDILAIPKALQEIG